MKDWWDEKEIVSCFPFMENTSEIHLVLNDFFWKDSLSGSGNAAHFRVGMALKKLLQARIDQQDKGN